MADYRNWSLGPPLPIYEGIAGTASMTTTSKAHHYQYVDNQDYPHHSDPALNNLNLLWSPMQQLGGAAKPPLQSGILAWSSLPDYQGRVRLYPPRSCMSSPSFSFPSVERQLGRSKATDESSPQSGHQPPPVLYQSTLGHITPARWKATDNLMSFCPEQQFPDLSKSRHDGPDGRPPIASCGPVSSSNLRQPLDMNLVNIVGVDYGLTEFCSLNSTRSATPVTPAMISTFPRSETITSRKRNRDLDYSDDKSGSSWIEADTYRKSQVKVKTDSKGNVQYVFSAGRPKRAKLSRQDKESTSLTRRVGSCPRCKRHKIRCNDSGNPYDPCKTCGALPRRRLTQPCSGVDILHLNLHRRGSTLNDYLAVWLLKKDILRHIVLLDGTHGQVRKFCLSQNMGVILEVTVSEFSPSPDDKLSYHWKDSSGQEHEMEMPPYYISDLEEAKRNIRAYASNMAPAYLHSLLADTSPMIRETFQQAWKLAHHQGSTLVNTALQLWVGTRLTEITWTISAGEEIGLTAPDNPENPWYNTIPVTPIMDTQLDELAIREILLPLQARFLRLFRERILEKKRENCLEIFIATFVIMNHFEFIFSDIIDYSERHGMTKSTSSGGPSLCQGYIHACKAILTYFHFASAGGAILFDRDLSAGAQKVENKTNMKNLSQGCSYITDEQALYIQRMRREIEDRKQKQQQYCYRPSTSIPVPSPRSMYKYPMYWSYQMFAHDWKGGKKSSLLPEVSEILPFTEKDFMTS